MPFKCSRAVGIHDVISGVEIQRFGVVHYGFVDEALLQALVAYLLVIECLCFSRTLVSLYQFLANGTTKLLKQVFHIIDHK
jgi:hypothetical protein